MTLYAMIVPFLLTAVGVTAASVGVVGYFVISAALSLGLAWGASKLLAPMMQKDAAAAEQGSQLQLKTVSDHPRMVPVGVVAEGGSLSYWQFSDNNQTLEMVIDLGDVPCGDLLSVIVDGVTHTIDSNGVVEGFDGKMVLRYHNGDWTQSADSELISRSVGSAWTANDKKSGVAYVVVELTYNTDKFPGGSPPRMTFIFQGAKLYDWRKDSTVGGSGPHRWNDLSTWEYSDNPVVIAYNWRRGFWYGGQHLYGMKTPSYMFDMASYTSGANICDETVYNKDGSTEKRYTCNCNLNTNATNRENLDKILRSCGGYEVNSGGIRKIGVAAPQASVKAIVDTTDIIANEPFIYTSKLSGDQLVNAVFGKFVDPLAGYQMNSTPPRISTGDETTDRERKAINMTFDGVVSQTQAQRLMEITRRLGRYQGTGKTRLRAACAGLEPGDWITLTVQSRGWVNKLFRLTFVEMHDDFQVTIEFREIGVEAFDYTAASDELDIENPATVVSGAPSSGTIAGLGLTPILVTLADSAQQRPGIAATWSAITDRTVIAIDFAYRVAGSSGDGLVKTTYEPTGTAFAWVDGILGSAQYEVRVRLITMPARSTPWTPWFAVTGTVQPLIVDTAALALGVPPGTITPEMLDAQTKFELALVTVTDDHFGSVNARLNTLFLEIQKTAQVAGDVMFRQHIDYDEHRTWIIQEQIQRESDDEALAQLITIVTAGLATANATITAIQTAYVTADSALASQITALTTTVGSHTTTITQLLSSVNGLGAMWGIAITTGNAITGLISLDSTNSVSTFSVVSDNFFVSLPSHSSGAPVQICAMGLVNGVPQLTIRANIIGDGAIAARSLSVVSLSAISADLGTVIAGLIRDAANTYQFQVSNGWLGHTDGSTYFDIKNKRFRIG